MTGTQLCLTCGSIIRGQRRPLVTMTPFSVEKESAGRPAMFQSRTSLGSARNRAKSKSSEAGTFSALICSTRAGTRAEIPGYHPIPSSQQATVPGRTQRLICSTCCYRHQLPNLPHADLHLCAAKQLLQLGQGKLNPPRLCSRKQPLQGNGCVSVSPSFARCSWTTRPGIRWGRGRRSS